MLNLLLKIGNKFNALRIVLAALIPFFCSCATRDFTRFFESGDEFIISNNSEIYLTILLPNPYTKEELEAAKILSNSLKNLGKGKILTTDIKENFCPYETIILKRKNPSNIKIDFIERFRNEVTSYVKVNPEFIEIEYEKNPKTAIGYFLRQLGFEYLAPTELGLVVPKDKNIRVKSGVYKNSPKFLSSDIYLGRLLKNPTEAFDFLKLNGMSTSFPYFEHNLNKIFDKKILEEYPEFKPCVKKFASDTLFQADISNPLAPKIAAEKASNVFKKYPYIAGYSISIADTTNFDLRIPQNKAPNNFAYGYQNYSDSYYEFANKTAQILSKNYPNKVLGTLAYLNTQSAPNFKIEPNIAIFATSDHANYFNKDFKISDFKKLKDWSVSGSKVLGLYSYIYGCTYRIPRNIEEYEFEAINKAYENNFRFYFAESIPSWAYDNFKIWLVLNLLNGTEKTFEELEDEYFKKYYKESAQSALEFFKYSRLAYANRTDSPRWLGLYKQNSEAEIFTSEILQNMEKSLKNAEDFSTSTLVKDRLFELRLEFEQTKAFCKDYWARKAISEALLNNKSENSAELISNFFEAKKDSKIYAKTRNHFTKFPSAELVNIDNFNPPLDTLFLKNFKSFTAKDFKIIKDSIGIEEFDELYNAATRPRKTIFETNFKFPNYSKYVKCFANFPPTLRAIAVPDKNASFCILESAQGKYKAHISNIDSFQISRTAEVKEDKVYVFSAKINYQIAISARMHLEFVFVDEFGNELSRKASGFASFKEPNLVEFQLVKRAPKGSKLAGFGLIGSYFRTSDFAEFESFKLEEVQEN